MWDNYVRRAPVNLPKLNLTADNERKVEEMLRPVDCLEMPTDSESDCCNSGSGVVDAFEEYHKNSFLGPLPGTKRKFLTKLEADWKTVEQFTEDYKRTVGQLRKDLELSDDLMAENERAIDEELTSNERHVFFDNKKLVVEEPILVPSRMSETETTSNSAVWNMIEAHKKEYFATSPPHYDIFNQNPAHYLTRPHVAWEEVERSRQKCEQWLRQCEQ